MPKPVDLSLNPEPHKLPTLPEGCDLSVQTAHKLNKERKVGWERGGEGWRRGEERTAGWEGLPGFQLCWISLLGFPWEVLPALIVNRGGRSPSFTFPSIP